MSMVDQERSHKKCKEVVSLAKESTANLAEIKWLVEKLPLQELEGNFDAKVRRVKTRQVFIDWLPYADGELYDDMVEANAILYKIVHKLRDIEDGRT